MPEMNCQCTERVTDSKVKVEENGKKAIFVNKSRALYKRIRLDGCLVTGTVTADWIVSDGDTGCVVVELKGKDVNHALDQVAAGLTYVKSNQTYSKKMAALIVCSGRPTHPSFTTKLQRIKQRFSRDFQAPIHIVSSNMEFELSNVLSFKGPLRG